MGKTTLLKCLTSILNNGKCVFYDGQSIEQNKHFLKNISCCLSEDTLYPYMTVKENIHFYKALFSGGQDFLIEVANILCKLKCSEYENHLVKNLSQGTRHKVYLAIMLSKKAKIFLLDEPFTALDKDSQHFFLELLKTKNKNDQATILLVTHVEEFAEIANKTLSVPKL